MDTVELEIVKLFKNINNDIANGMNKIIFLLFDKAIDENNPLPYAQLYKELNEKYFMSDSEFKPLQQQFTKALVTKCENEFRANVLANIKMKLLPFVGTIDPARKAEYQAKYDEEKRKLNNRSIATVRFIGEIFKIGMLTPNIMMNCISSLLDSSSEEKLECLCELLMTVGDRLENYGTMARDLDVYFLEMKGIVDKKYRVGLMMQHVIDLRKKKWSPTREAVGVTIKRENE